MGVLLLNLCDVSCDIIDRGRVLIIQAVGLALEASLVDEDSRVGREPCEGEAHVGVDLEDLVDGAGVLELGGALLLHGEDDGLAPADADGGGTPVYGGEGVLYLVETAVRGECGEGSVVTHCWCSLFLFLL